MDETKARGILGSAICEYGLHSDAPYFDWKRGEEVVTIDGCVDADLLAAIVFWMGK